MKRLMSLLAVTWGVLSVALVPVQPAAAASAPAAADLRLEMRQLWEEHITYTRNYIISALGGLKDTDKVAGRSLRNQDDIGQAIARIAKQFPEKLKS
jgi:hypothetical protein